jgi:hypothetical protein
MQDKLIAMGWKCVKCSCPGGKGVDCANDKYRKYLITIRDNFFRILENGMVIDSGHSYQLDKKLKINGLL